LVNSDNVKRDALSGNSPL